MELKEGYIGFLYPDLRSIFSTLICYFSKGVYTHTFFIYSIDKKITIAESRFPKGIILDDLKKFKGRNIDFYEVKGLTKTQLNEIKKWFKLNIGKPYDVLYLMTYPLKKLFHLQLKSCFTCNEAVYYALKWAGIHLEKWKTPSEIAQSKYLVYKFTTTIS